MNTIVSDNKFIGYGRSIHCTHCNNRVVEHVFMPFLAQGFFYLPYFKDRFGVIVICPICHVDTTANANTEGIAAILEAGKHHTKRFYAENNNWLQKRSLLRDLRKLGFHDLAQFLES